MRSGACLGLAGLVSGLLFSLTDQRTARATGPTTIVNSYFTSTGDVTNASTNNWNVGGNSAAQSDTTAAQDSVGACSTSPVKYPCMVNSSGDNSAPYHLRLTNAETAGAHQNETGYAIYTIPQTSAYGLDFSFDASIHGYGGNGCPASPTDNWNNTSTGGLLNSQFNCQADGFSFILQNGADTNTSSSVIGEPGGSLGYGSQSVTGFDGGLLALGFDAYGNNYHIPFGSNNYDPSTLCSGTDASTGGNGGGDPAYSAYFARKSLIIRGPEGYSSTTHTSANLSRGYGYCRIASQQDRSSWSFGSTSLTTNSGVSLASTSLFSTSGASIRILIDPSDSTAGPRGTGTVFMGAAGATPTTLLATFQLPQQLLSAPTFRFGFVAGTGGGEAEMDIWSTSVQSITSIPQVSFQQGSNLCVKTGDNLVLSGHNGIAPYSISVSGLPAGASVTSRTSTSATISGLTSSPSLTATITDSSPTPVSVSATFNVNVRSNCGVLEWDIGSTQTNDDGYCTTGSYTENRSGDTITAFFYAQDQSNSGTCFWTPPTGVSSVAIVAVAGGGGGGGKFVAGGGGAGAYYFNSSVSTSSRLSITIGKGGAGGAAVAGTSGSSGADTVITGGASITVKGGGGGGAYTSSNHPGNGSTGGSGGGGSGNNNASPVGQGGAVASGSISGSLGNSGANGAGGVSGNPGGGGGGSAGAGSSPVSGIGGSGGAGTLNPLTNVFLAAGGGGGSDATCSTSASSIGGVGGCNSGSVNATNATFNTGSGGGGADGGAGAGGNGSSGIVIIQYSGAVYDSASNNSNVNVNANFQTSPSNTPQGTEYSADLSNGSCGSFSYVSIVTFPISSLSRGSGHGKCYYWTFLGTNAIAPTFNSIVASNLTSPILYLPQKLTLNLPSVINVDPRAKFVDFPIGANPAGPDQGLVCLYESTANSTNGGTGITSNGLIFDVGTVGTQDSNYGGVLITGDLGPAVQLSANSLANLNDLLASTRAADSGLSSFNLQRNILVRVVPTLPQAQFTSSCDPNSGAELIPTSSDAYVIQVIPYGLSVTINQPRIDLGHHR